MQGNEVTQTTIDTSVDVFSGLAQDRPNNLMRLEVTATQSETRPRHTIFVLDVSGSMQLKAGVGLVLLPPGKEFTSYTVPRCSLCVQIQENGTYSVWYTTIGKEKNDPKTNVLIKFQVAFKVDFKQDDLLSRLPFPQKGGVPVAIMASSLEEQEEFYLFRKKFFAHQQSLDILGDCTPHTKESLNKRLGMVSKFDAMKTGIISFIKTMNDNDSFSVIAFAGKASNLTTKDNQRIIHCNDKIQVDAMIASITELKMTSGTRIDSALEHIKPDDFKGSNIKREDISVVLLTDGKHEAVNGQPIVPFSPEQTAEVLKKTWHTDTVPFPIFSVPVGLEAESTGLAKMSELSGIFDFTYASTEGQAGSTVVDAIHKLSERLQKPHSDFIRITITNEAGVALEIPIGRIPYGELAARVQEITSQFLKNGEQAKVTVHYSGAKPVETTSVIEVQGKETLGAIQTATFHLTERFSACILTSDGAKLKTEIQAILTLANKMDNQDFPPLKELREKCFYLLAGNVKPDEALQLASKFAISNSNYNMSYNGLNTNQKAIAERKKAAQAAAAANNPAPIRPANRQVITRRDVDFSTSDKGSQFISVPFSEEGLGFRETIVMDVTEAWFNPILADIQAIIVEEQGKSATTLSTQRIIEIACRVIHQHLPNMDDASMQALVRCAEEVSMADAIKAKTGNSRYHSMLLGAVLGALVNSKNLPQGSVRQCLGLAANGKTTSWVVYHAKSNESHVSGESTFYFADSTNDAPDFCLPINNAASKAHAIQVYADKGFSGVLSRQFSNMATEHSQEVAAWVKPTRAELATEMAAVKEWVESNEFGDIEENDLRDKDYICPITLMPPTDPVSLPGTNQVYEKSALQATLAITPRNPTTNEDYSAGIPEFIFRPEVVLQLFYYQARQKNGFIGAEKNAMDNVLGHLRPRVAPVEPNPPVATQAIIQQKLQGQFEVLRKNYEQLKGFHKKGGIDEQIFKHTESLISLIDDPLTYEGKTVTQALDTIHGLVSSTHRVVAAIEKDYMENPDRKNTRQWRETSRVVRGLLGILSALLIGIPALVVALGTKEGYVQNFFGEKLSDKMARSKTAMSDTQAGIENAKNEKNQP